MNYCLMWRIARSITQPDVVFVIKKSRLDVFKKNGMEQKKELTP